MDQTQMFYALLAAIPIAVFLYRRSHPLYAIPAIGLSAPLLSYIGAIMFTRHAREVLKEGYRKYRGSAFRIALLDRWVVILCGPEMNEELHRIPDDQMSFLDAAEELVQTRYTIAADVIDNPIHIAVIKGPLTRNLALMLPDVVDEIQVAAQEMIPAQGNEWVSVPGLDTMSQLVCRVSNRVFVGTPMCRNPDYLKTVVNFPRDVAKGRFVLGFVPTFLKPIVGPMLPWSRRTLKQFSAVMRPYIVERKRLLEEHGKDWGEKPNDLMTWLIEEGKAINQPIDLVVNAMLSANFVAIHTSSTSITHALFHLAARPEYIQPLRDEIVSVVKSDGWTKIAIGKMWKLDSFMRESQRMNGISGISVIRKALKDVTLSDGTVIPAGTLCGVAAYGTHYDEDIYADPYVFNPFRFSNMREDDKDSRIKHQYVSTSAEYVPFGHGKHACPGRFFAANELKAILAQLVLNYDVKFENGRRPEDLWFGSSIIPNQTARVMFRKRPDAFTL